MVKNSIQSCRGDLGCPIGSTVRCVASKAERTNVFAAFAAVGVQWSPHFGRPANVETMKVLIVDDNQDMRELVKTTLEFLSYIVICAKDGKKGWKRRNLRSRI
jgi:hypothetical protein